MNHVLRKSGIDFFVQQTDSLFQGEDFSPDILLCDCGAESGSVLQSARLRYPQIPVIFFPSEPAEEGVLKLLQAASESNTVFRSIIENAPIRVFWKDKNLRYLGCNTAFARDAGLERPDDLIGKDDFQMTWHDKAEIYRADDRRVMDSGIPKLNYEEPQITPDGRDIWLRTSKVPLRDAQGKVLGVLGIYDDITEARRLESNRKNLQRALALVRYTNSALIHVEDERILLAEVCRLAVEAGGYLMAWVGFPENDEDKSVRPAAEAGFEEGYLEKARITWAENERGRGPTGTAIRTGTIQVNQNFLTNAAVAPWRDSALKHGYQSSLALPLVDSGKVLGSLTLYAREPDAFSQEETQLLAELAGDLAFGIAHLRMRKDRDIAVRENQHYLEKLRKSLEDALQAISTTVEMRDPYTAGHQRRVAHLAVAIAREMGLSEEQIHGIHLSAIVHDIGKIHIPAEILSKPGRLSEIEYSLIKVHPESGYDILKEIDFPWPIAQAVLQHHERMDGSGYPRGLKGEEIIIEARILAVADVVEAIYSHRPYRPGRGLDAALEELGKNRGILYDSAVADACFRLFQEKGWRLPAN